MCRTFQSKRFNWNLFFQSSYTELRSPKTFSPSNYNPWLPSNFLSQTILRTLIHFLSQTILRTLILLAHSSHAKISNIQKRVSLFIFSTVMLQLFMWKLMLPYIISVTGFIGHQLNLSLYVAMNPVTEIIYRIVLICFRIYCFCR
jgi:hypothetical protein